MGILGIPLSALPSSSFYTPLQLLCKGKLDGLLFLDIPRGISFFQTCSGLHAQWTRCASATRCTGVATVRKLLGQDAMFIFMVAESEMALVKRLVERKTESFGNVVCNCNFVICTVKYTHTCVLGRGFNLEKNIKTGSMNQDPISNHVVCFRLFLPPDRVAHCWVCLFAITGLQTRLHTTGFASLP